MAQIDATITQTGDPVDTANISDWMNSGNPFPVGSETSEVTGDTGFQNNGGPVASGPETSNDPPFENYTEVSGTRMGGNEENNMISCTDWSPATAASTEEFIDQTRTCTETYDVTELTATFRGSRTVTFTQARVQPQTRTVETTFTQQREQRQTRTCTVTVNGLQDPVSPCTGVALQQDIPATPTTRTEDTVTNRNVSATPTQRTVDETNDRTQTITAASMGNTRSSSTGPDVMDGTTLVSGSNTGTSRRIENPDFVSTIAPSGGRINGPGTSSPSGTEQYSVSGLSGTTPFTYAWTVSGDASISGSASGENVIVIVDSNPGFLMRFTVEVRVSNAAGSHTVGPRTITIDTM